jgi:CRISPR/Cas system CSM-associated protein Csm4 (group 5 of RAMP superfamily)
VRERGWRVGAAEEKVITKVSLQRSFSARIFCYAMRLRKKKTNTGQKPCNQPKITFLGIAQLKQRAAEEQDAKLGRLRRGSLKVFRQFLLPFFPHKYFFQEQASELVKKKKKKKKNPIHLFLSTLSCCVYVTQ